MVCLCGPTANPAPPWVSGSARSVATPPMRRSSSRTYNDRCPLGYGRVYLVDARQPKILRAYEIPFRTRHSCCVWFGRERRWLSDESAALPSDRRPQSPQTTTDPADAVRCSASAGPLSILDFRVFGAGYSRADGPPSRVIPWGRGGVPVSGGSVIQRQPSPRLPELRWVGLWRRLAWYDVCVDGTRCPGDGRLRRSPVEPVTSCRSRALSSRVVRTTFSSRRR